MKKILILLLFLTTIPLSTAITFYEDEIVDNGYITYVFKEGLIIDDYKISDKGLIINEQLVEFSSSKDGLVINVYSWGGLTDNKIGFYSNESLVVDFFLQNNNTKYYFFDGNSYSLDEYHKEEGSVIGGFKNLGNSYQETVEDELEESFNIPWYKVIFLEFEIDTYKKDGIIYSDRVFSLTVGWLVFVLGIVFLLMILIFFNKR